MKQIIRDRNLLIRYTVFSIFVLLLSIITFPVLSQNNVGRIFKGIVIDAETEEPLPNANIISRLTSKRNIVADENGFFSIKGIGEGEEWIISVAGFEEAKLDFNKSDSIQIIKLSPFQTQLKEVEIRPGKQKYSKRNNPAVEFVKRLRRESKDHDPEEADYYSYDKYEKTLIALNDFKGDFSSGYLSKGGKFLKDYIDKSPVTGRDILNLMLKEKKSTWLSGKKVEGSKEIITGYRSCGVDEFINEDNMRIILEDAVREIDPFKDDITLLQNRFVSPLSKIGPDVYKYYLTDTVELGNQRCIELSFVPHNPQTMGFNGKIYVPLGDTAMFVKKITMRTPSDINMNLIDNIFINLSYEKDSVGNRIKVYDDVCIEMSLLSKLPKIYGRKTTLYDNFSYERHSLLEPYYSEMGSIFISEESGKKDPAFWNEARKIPLSVSEERMGGLMKEIRRNPILYWGEKGLKLLVEGYIKTGNPSKFEIGPINTFISGNTVEGVRLRFGGMTMAALNPHFFASGYVAYGTRDRKWKYEGLLEYSFPSKRNFFNEWPRHGFSLKYKYDIDMLGQHYLFANADNVFLSFKRMESILATYQRQGSLSYILELPNHFSLETGIKLWKQEATWWVPFKFPDGRILTDYRENSVSISVRWAPGEKFIQGRTKRSPVNMDSWIFQLTHEFGPKGLLNSAFTINNTELSVRKRFWFSAFGYTGMILKGGMIWSSVYFPALMWPNANLTYTIQPESYSLMNPMEFANDKYASVDLSYFGLGVLFNRIPLLKRLKLREVVTFKALTGGLSDRNNPSKNEDLLLFPSQAQTRTLSSVPYMEAGVGIDNIFMFLRVDYVWRLTYRDTPGCDKSGLRISLHFSF